MLFHVTLRYSTRFQVILRYCMLFQAVPWHSMLLQACHFTLFHVILRYSRLFHVISRRSCCSIRRNQPQACVPIAYCVRSGFAPNRQSLAQPATYSILFHIISMLFHVIPRDSMLFHRISCYSRDSMVFHCICLL